MPAKYEPIRHYLIEPRMTRIARLYGRKWDAVLAGALAGLLIVAVLHWPVAQWLMGAVQYALERPL